MNAVSRDPLNPTAFEIPDPPEEFGQDGGKFYRAYDAFAGEIDEDMTASLKEQLDGMLIFAGLFAGVNTAFLALTIPLLSADPSDDTNALLNSILMQMSSERNSTVQGNSELPSAGFTPSTNIFAINALFGLSLAFAIISSFLAVLGRQWLVYYRKRSGGGPDRQRWEQIKRLLGAHRWHMELILDDVLPSLLQTGLIIFCVSLIIYLHHLSPAVSIVVGIPLYLGLAVFVVSALCTLWDRFCPFHSPLSHLLYWITQNIPLIVVYANSGIRAGVRFLYVGWPQFVQRLKQIARHGQFSPQGLATLGPIKSSLRTLRKRRQEETLEFLQVFALRRVICTSDDPMTLLHATANIIGITNQAQLGQLWSDTALQERLFNQLGDSHMRMLQLRSPHLVDTAASIRRIYCTAITHITLYLDLGWDWNSRFYYEICKFREATVMFTGEELSSASTTSIQTTLGFSICQFYTYYPSLEAIKSFCDRFNVYSDALERNDWRLLCLTAWIASNLPWIRVIHVSSIASLRLAYRGDVEHALESIENAIDILTQPECSALADCDRILSNILNCLHHYITLFDQPQSKLTLEHKFALLEICERILRSPQLPGAAQHVREIRVGLSVTWQKECTVAAHWLIPERLPDLLDQYIRKIRTIHPDQSGYHDCLDVLRVFGPSIRRLLSYGSGEWEPAALGKRFALIKTFNKLVQEVDRTSHQIQYIARRARSPDERWCHWEEETISIWAIYSVSPDGPESRWKIIAEQLRVTHEFGGSTQ